MTAATHPHTRTRASKRAVDYPTGDGKPMAEDSLHRDQMNYTIGALTFFFSDRPDVYVSGNDFLYYQEGEPRKRVSPDCYVAMGVEKKPRRRFYKVWEEGGIVPSVVFEFTSKKTRHEDEVGKRHLYEDVLRVAEYIQFDPEGDYLNPRLKGRRLVAGAYVDLPLVNEQIHSEALGLDLVVVGERLRLFDPARGEWLLSLEEQAERARAEAARADMEEARADAEAARADTEREGRLAAEAEVARLRAELEKRSPHRE
jgi:Uma2 family endonuclease